MHHRHVPVILLDKNNGPWTERKPASLETPQIGFPWMPLILMCNCKPYQDISAFGFRCPDMRSLPSSCLSRFSLAQRRVPRRLEFLTNKQKIWKKIFNRRFSFSSIPGALRAAWRSRLKYDNAWRTRAAESWFCFSHLEYFFFDKVFLPFPLPTLCSVNRMLLTSYSRILAFGTAVLERWNISRTLSVLQFPL